MMFYAPLKMVPVLIHLKTQPYTLLKISETTLVLEKSIFSVGFG